MKQSVRISGSRGVISNTLRACVYAAAVGGVVACAGNSPLNETVNAQGVPTWVSQGSNIFSSKQARVFHGVGSAPMLGDFSLQTVTADKRARNELNRILASFVEIVSRDFIASGDAAESGFGEQDVARQIEQLANIDLAGVRVIGHWQDKQNKMMYSIAEMDMAQVREAIMSAGILHPGLREFIKKSGDNIFDRIATAEE
ncbi:MAG TPA: hypothetical protein ENI97_10545 [Gammaproteobacteria bacterium]|nr:hypothetical protein [Gammaproteobacteria bacterium]